MVIQSEWVVVSTMVYLLCEQKSPSKLFQMAKKKLKPVYLQYTQHHLKSFVKKKLLSEVLTTT